MEEGGMEEGTKETGDEGGGGAPCTSIFPSPFSFVSFASFVSFVSRLTSDISLFCHSGTFLHPFGCFFLTSQSIATAPELLFHCSRSVSEPSVNCSATAQEYFTGS